MNAYDPAADRAPLFVRGPMNVYMTTVLVAFHVVTMIVTTLLTATRSLDVLQALAFDSAMALPRIHVWQFATYAFVNGPTLWFAFNLFMFHFCGRELEQFFGRRAYRSLYVLAILTPSLVAAVYGLFSRSGLSGCWLPHFIVLAAYAFVFPRTVFFFSIPAIWIAAAVFGITSLAYLADHLWMDLIALWVGVGGAWIWVKWQRGEIRLPQRKASPSAPAPPPEVDVLLDKISREGLHSLSAAERRTLEKARERMLKP